MPSKTTVTFDLDELYRREEEAKKRALWLQGQAVIATAQRDRLVPFETGTLRRSAMTTLEELPSMQEVYGKAEEATGQKPVVVDDPKNHNGDIGVAYVSYNTPYAAALHENEKWKARREGGWKWIEKALAAIAPRLPEIAAKEIKRFLS